MLGTRPAESFVVPPENIMNVSLENLNRVQLLFEGIHSSIGSTYGVYGWEDYSPILRYLPFNLLNWLTGWINFTIFIDFG